MAGTVHRLQRENFLVPALSNEHVLAEILPVPGRLPQRAVEQLRPLDLLVTGRVEPPAHIVLDDPKQLPALGMPEDAADRLFLQVEQVELAAEAAMVAAFGLFEPEQVLVKLLLVRPSRAVDPLQLRLIRVAAPIGAGNIHQLEGLPEPPGRGEMRPDTEIDEIALPIEADLLLGRDLADVFGLITFADAVEEGDGLVAIPHFTVDRLVAPHDVAHALLDALEPAGRERRRPRAVVIKPGLGRRASGNVRSAIQPLGPPGHQPARVEAQDLLTPRAA